MDKYFPMVQALEKILSENELEILNDALQCYGRHPEDHSYDEESDVVREMAFAFDWFGYNLVLPDHDITKI